MDGRIDLARAFVGPLLEEVILLWQPVSSKRLDSDGAVFRLEARAVRTFRRSTIHLLSSVSC